MSKVIPIEHPGRPREDEIAPEALRETKHVKEIMMFQSLRAYRRFLDRVALQCYTGQRPMSDLPKAAAFCKVGAEVFLAENQLARHGLDRQFEDHPLGSDGGLGDTALPRGYVEKTVKRKSGVSRTGAEIEETVRSVTGPAHSKAFAEAVKEIEDLF